MIYVRETAQFGVRMNILLVDDEQYVIESLIQKISFNKLLPMSIYTANNIRQARTVMQMIPVHIVICDIVMPQGSGFEFIAWVREEGYPVQVIFLTSYAEFDYAQKAIALDSVDYLLKPIDFEKLTETIQKASCRIQQHQKFEEYRTESVKWNQSKHFIQGDFIKQIISGQIAAAGPELEQIMERMQIDYKLTDLFIPVYVHFYRGNPGEEYLDESILKFIISNVINELLEQRGMSVELVLLEGQYRYILIVKGKGAIEDQIIDLLAEGLEAFLTWEKEKISMDMWCAIGQMIELTKIPQTIDRLINMRENNLTIWNCVIRADNQNAHEVIYENAELKIWKKLLMDHNTAELIIQMEQYLDNLESMEMITLESLKKFRLDVTQLIYSYLSGQEILAHRLFASKESEQIMQLALEGIKGAKAFLRHYVEKAVDYTNFTNHPKSVVDTLIQYIDQHYQEDIHRENLAELVYLNIDYISRIFKREKGMSISAYLLQKRVTEAKKLLTETNLPINGVSIYVGYSNFSYFTKMFRENTGYSPLEYRRKYKTSSLSMQKAIW